jgi:carbon monoxide dehydrogenase subunit G
MKLQGERRLDAPRDTVWGVLNDPASMAKTMPGVESFDIADDRHWSANVKIPLGLGGLRMRVDFEKLEEREPEFARLKAKGNGVGAIMNMETQFHLAEAEGATQMRWEADVRIAGPVGSMGQRVLQPIVNQQVGNVLNALEAQVNEAAAGDGPAKAAGAGDTGDSSGPSTGSAGTPEPTTDREPPETDPELKDAGEPSSGDADREGSSGAEEGLSPLAPESYDPEPKGPTTSTDD